MLQFGGVPFDTVESTSRHGTVKKLYLFVYLSSAQSLINFLTRQMKIEKSPKRRPLFNQGYIMGIAGMGIGSSGMDAGQDGCRIARFGMCHNGSWFCLRGSHIISSDFSSEHLNLLHSDILYL